MALPVILIDSATGSDTAASGAGPGTALTGTLGVSAGDGLSVVLDGSPDLSGVATDGSHVLYYADATAGNRNFAKITGTSGSGGPTATVTISDAVGTTLTKAWAIGGKRASLLSTTSAKLVENNSGNGDAMPGWIMQMASGHTETRSSTINPRRSGDLTNGRIIVQGASGAATRPIITFSNNGNCFVPRGDKWTFQNFELQNSNATKTASLAIASVGVLDLQIRNLKIANSTNKFWKAMGQPSGTDTDLVIEDCEIANTANNGIDLSVGVTFLRCKNNVVYSCGNHGMAVTAGPTGALIEGNIFAYNTADGVNHAYAGTSRLHNQIKANVFHGNGGDGLEIAATATNLGTLAGLLIENNRFTFNIGYGLNFSGASMADVVLAGIGSIIRNNNFFTNTLGKYNGMTITSSINEVTVDPSGGLASATKDYAGATTGTNFMSSVSKALGYPIGGTLAVGTGSNSYNYQDMGLQHQDSGSSGMLYIPNLDGV